MIDMSISLCRAFGLIFVLGNATLTYAGDDRLCPRGDYSFTLGEKRTNELQAKVTLPTTGYSVTLYQSSELIKPPKVYFFCKKPEGMAGQVLTLYVAKLSTPVSQLMLVDSDGSQLVSVKSDGVMVSGTPEQLSPPKTCKSDDVCGSSEFCDTTPKCQDGANSGICTLKPQYCTKIFLPVTACNGQTYSNACEAMADGQPLPGVKKARLLGGDGVFPLEENGRKNDPGDHWPFSCNKLGSPGDPWPWGCSKTMSKNK